ncbi:diguanylate cyclase domain-containing protein [Methylobacterium gnaphalii]|uniref:GGDEF domain-containing protein n=1 Tax=Methylobacterium gnaphalii TaxID=1010610 RepID=A0A512JQ47_9HYPH|nr:diguanylate cyclase [Methylobacterium gnaphalii]GEP12086.1 hypothetical protein MGN01_39310 [Methylobacterium gnaphalii]GJD71022.1 hypothetical protein MMMDOFMJ_3976 [Methylobacterium gnaphalii]GLS48203.1 hypothetical protein GCM10007885_10470 [Methylobacterium gnaphalii]
MSNGSAPDPLTSLLERIRCSFFVRAALIQLIDEEDGPIELCAGAPIRATNDPAFRRLQSLAASDTVIFPDLDLEAGLPRAPLDRPRVCFFAGTPLLSDAGHAFGILYLLHSHPRWLSPLHIRAFEDFAAEIAPLAQRRRDAATIARLRSRIEAQAEHFARSRDTFERAAAEVRVGLWTCALRDESLNWSHQVYDMFGIARGSRLDRQRALECYNDRALGLLERVRSEALRQRRGFQLEAEIVTQKGAQRWIRINAEVDCSNGEPVRLFGMKQDITEQKLLLDRTRFLAERDAMTGLANRAQFEKQLSTLASATPRQSSITALMLVDLDDFKQVNDSYGHAVGDDCLKEATRRLSEICVQANLVARIGGDEFAILLGPSFEREAIEALGEDVVTALARPMACARHLLRIGASIGIAHVAGSCSPSDLFDQADMALYAAKAAGRRTVRSFVPEIGGTSERRIPWPLAPNRERAGLPQPTTH